MKRSVLLSAFVVVALASCTSNSNPDKKYIEDTVVHEADSPIIPDRSMVPEPDTTDRNLSNPHSKEPVR